MIKLSGIQKTVRETTAKFEYEDEGKIKSEEIRVQYYSPTITELRQFEAELRAKVKDGEPSSTFYLTEFLVRRIHALPDLADTKGKVRKITLDFIESLDVKNLERIRDAINEDLNPKSTPGS